MLNIFGFPSFLFQLQSFLGWFAHVETSFGGLRNHWSLGTTFAYRKDEGGLGFEDMKCWNSALLSKALWNIKRKKDTIWVKWINHMYLKRTNIWECTANKGDSPLINRLLEIRNQLLEWTKASCFSVHIAYDFFRKAKRAWTTEVWKRYIMLKHSFILLLEAQSKLLTKDRLPHFNIDPTCVFCTAHEETCDIYFLNVLFPRLLGIILGEQCLLLLVH